jgi:hypothetical protein
VKRFVCIVALALVSSLNVVFATPVPQQPAPTPLTQAQQASRDATREKLRTLLNIAGARKDVNVAFRQSEKQPYNFVGIMREGLANADSLEIVISVTTNETIGFRVYPHYNGAYINVDKAKNGAGMMRKLLSMSDHNFLYWGADETGDVFSGYTFTLESGFPEEAIVIVLRSIRNTDGFVGELRPTYDGTFAPSK